ncbi:MAG: NAD-dependent epimerase/dehydratase family protein [Negativicutes bacterium]|nr:NAD-dependent epimerase/dehydratase family protein [Negativicutes bacterium]
MVFYCAGLTSGFIARPFDAFDAHFTLPAKILASGRFESFVYLSSTRVYCQSAIADENTPLSVMPHLPDHIYNISKLSGESICHAVDDPRVKVVRLSNVHSRWWGDNKFISRLVSDAVLTGQIRPAISPESAKDYVDIDDVCECLVKVALSSRHKVYNLASGHNVALGTITRLIAEVTGAKCMASPHSPIVSFPTIVTERIRSEFNFIPRQTLANNVISMCRHFCSLNHNQKGIQHDNHR